MSGHGLAEAPDGEPRSSDVAIVGVGCRFPGGVADLDALWRVFGEGVDVVGPPPDRPVPGFVDTAMPGAYLADVDRFDADLFGISPREAQEMDPQQRLLLEVAFSAVENAGIPLSRLVGSHTGVYLGILAMDYAMLHARTLGHDAINSYYASGKEFSFGAGRIAHTFGLHGPSIMVNAACASSLLSVHLAVRALRGGECDAALAGGVNLILGPELSVFMRRVHAFSPHGVCRPFDAAADGVVRGEGCGVVVLKRHDDAVRDGDRVLAVIRGSATNHDGHSAGLTTPNVTAQEMLLRSALRDAGVTAADLDFVEAHSTGTPLGDPIELSALGAVFGPDRPTDRPLLIGSHKANFGHLDSAAGILGLLKALLVVRHGTVPRQIKLEQPTPGFDWADSGLRVPTSAMDIDDRGRPRIAGVSAFGLSGSNVHVILEQALSPAPAKAADRPKVIDPVLVVSGTTEDAVRAQSHAFERALATTSADALDDLLHSASVRRTQHKHRLVVTGADSSSLAAALRADRDGQPLPGTVRRVVDAERASPIVHVFSGQGSQWPGMGLDLAASPIVRETFDECDVLLRRLTGWSLPTELARDTSSSRLSSTEIAQPAIFVLQLALSRWWASIGAAPDAVIGHSMGEIGAACVAGALEVPDALRLIVTRGRLLERAAGSGRMTAVRLSAEDTKAALAAHPAVTIAAINGPHSVVIAGPDDAVAAVEEDLRGRRVVCVPLAGRYPFHSPAMRSYGEELAAQLGDLRTARPTVPFVSTVDPSVREPSFDAEYWSRNVWQPVLFAPAVDRILAERAAVFVEVGPHAVLSAELREAQHTRGQERIAVAGITRGESASRSLAKAVATLHAAGVDLDWSAIYPDGRYRPLPPTPLGGARYWLPEPARDRPSSAPSPEKPPAPHPSPSPAGDPAAETRDEVATTVAATVAEVLGHDASWRPSRVRGLFELGMDSLGLTELARRLGERFGRELDASVAIQYPTINALTEHLLPQVLTGSERTPTTAVNRPDVRASTGVDGDAIAVVGIGCRLPSAPSPGEYWQLLCNGCDAVTEPPAGRFPSSAAVPDGAPRRAAYLERIDGFDNTFFRISAREARSMDPQQRLFAEVAWEALEDAGIDTARLHGGRTGLFVGMNTTDYQQLVTRDPANVDPYYGTGNSFSGAAGRLSYFLGVRGPSIAVDTACSSSLVAVHLAARSLGSGESEIAVAGGVNVMATPTVFRAMSAGGALAPDGRCKTFDAAADGYGRGEGAAVVVLKTLSRAVADGDRIYAVINGSAVNHNGASGGLTAPSSTAQEELMRTALDQAGWSAADLDYLEAHGTGTRLGDEVELAALDRVLARQPPRQPLLVGSAKTNIGHLEAAAGVAGLVKTVLALWHEEIPAHLHCRNPAGPLATATARMRVATERTAWPRQAARPRRAGVSAFGLTGTNAHVLLTEPPPVQGRTERARLSPSDQRHLLVLSAASETALTAMRQRWREWLTGVDETHLTDVCYTAAARRTHLEHRLAVVGSSRRELINGLSDIPGEASRRQGVVPAGTEDHTLAEQVADLDTLAERYVHGERIDWERVFGGRRQVRTLPSYPWQHRRHWVDTAADDRAATSLPGAVFAPADGKGSRYLPVSFDRADLPEAPAVVGTAELLAVTLTAARELVSASPCLRDVRLRMPAVSRATVRDPQVMTRPDGAGSRLCFLARPTGAAPVELLTAAVCVAELPTTVDTAELDNRCRQPVGQCSPQDTVYFLDPTELPDLRSSVDGRTLRADTPDPTDEAGLLNAAAALAASHAKSARPVVLTEIGELTLHPRVPGPVTLVAVADGAAVDVRAVDPDGLVVLDLRGLWFGPAEAADVPARARERVERGCYTVRWRAVELDSAQQRATLPPGPGRWLTVAVTARAVPTALRLAGQLRAADTEVDVVAVGPAIADGPGATGIRRVDNADELTDIVTTPRELGGIVLACAPGNQTEVVDHCAVVLRLAEALGARTSAAKLWLVAPGAQEPVGVAVADRHQSALWAFGRVLATELAGRWGGLIDANGGGIAAAARRILDAAADGSDGEDELCLRGDHWYAPRLGRADPLPPALSPVRCHADRWYAMTDGLHPAHRPVLDWLLGAGARKLLDLRGPFSATSATIAQTEAELRDRGIEVRSIAVADIVAGGDAAATAIAEPWAGVVLTAPPVTVRMIGELGPAELRSPWDWADTVAAVDALTGGEDLDFFVVTGSTAAHWGSVGTAAQAAVEGFVDGIVAARARRDAPVTMLRWMPRVDSGELTARDQAVMRGSGLRPLRAADIAEALDPAVRVGASTALADVDEPSYVAACRGQTHRSFLAELAATAESAQDGPTALVTELAAMAPGPRADRLLDLVLSEVASALGEHGSSDVEPDRGFFELGMDSVLLLSLRGQLQRLLGWELPSTVTFEFPTTRALTEHLLERVGDVSAEDRIVKREGEPVDLGELSTTDLMDRLRTAVSNARALLGESE